jgi:molybdate transport system ATP-binding protein
MLTLNVQKQLAEFTLHIDVTCFYPVTAVFGPSGSGKTTLLNLVSGLMCPDKGEIRIDDTLLFHSEQGIDLPPEKRRIGHVFQDDLLFPHLNVRQNLLYGYQFLAPQERKFHLNPIVELLELGALLDRPPNMLSGGERQRVALGRAILTSPKLLIMDEPLAALDQGLKDRIMPYLRHIRTDLGIPMLYVSHAVGEILQLTGQVIVLNRGQVLAHGDFFTIAHQPNILPMLEAHGFENVLPVEVIAPNRVKYNDQILHIPPCDRKPKTHIFIGIRANDIILCRKRPEGLSIRNAIRGRVIDIIKTAGKQIVYIDIGKRLAAEVTPEAIEELALKIDEPVVCLIKTHSIRIGPDVS